MDVNKNGYTFFFATLMVVVVAATLSVAFIQLKPLQDSNVNKEKMQNILSTIGVEASRDEAEKLYPKYIVSQLVLNAKGEITVDEPVEMEGGKVKESQAFAIDLAKELKKEVSAQQFPLYVAEKDGKKLYVVPLRGKGLWGPIWGYLSLKEDMNTVFGASFDHKTETPGLGAEINKGWFQEPFIGKKIYDKEGNFVSIIVTKGGAAPDDLHGVDAISGGTITSDGVTNMLAERLGNYQSYFEKNKPKPEPVKVIEAPRDSTATDSLLQAGQVINTDSLN